MTEGGIQSAPIEVVEGSAVLDLSGDDNFHIAVAQERVDGENNAAGGVIPFAASGGKGMFYFDSMPPYVPMIDEEIAGGHESAEDGRLYQFNFEVAFSDDDPNAILPRSVELGQVPSDPPQHSFSIAVRNSGQTKPLTISSVEVTGGAQQASFSVVDFPNEVPAGGQGTINLQLDSGCIAGAYQAIVEIKSDDETVEDQTISLEISAGVVNLLGPVARISLDDAAGATDLADASGNNRNGVVSPFDGSATLGEAGLNAETGTALKVSGGGGGAIQGSAFDAFDEFGISLWMNAEELGSSADAMFGTVVGMGEASPLFGLLISDGEIEWFGDVDGAAGPLFRSDSTPIQQGMTHHLVMSRSLDRASIWVDGVEVAGIDSPPAVGDTITSTFYFGGFNGALGLNGVIDDLQVYDRALTEANVSFLNTNPGKTLGDTKTPDPDEDGLTNAEEAEAGTDPVIADTDEDGLLDGLEVKTLPTDPLDADSDDDGLLDGAEVNTHNTDPLKADTDGDNWGDALEIAKEYDPLDPGDPGVPPPVRSGDPNDPLVARANVDGWSSVMVIDEERFFDFQAAGASSGIVENFEFWVGTATGRVTPFIAERTADNEFIVRHIGTTRVFDVDYKVEDEGTAVSFPFDANNDGIEAQHGWVAGFTVANPDGSENEGAVIPFDGNGGDMWLAGGPAPEESVSITVGEAPNTEAAGTVFTDSLARVYAFAITSSPGGDPPPKVEITAISKTAEGVALQIPAGATYDIQYSADLISWDTIAEGITGSYTDQDAARVGLKAGHYRGVLK